MRIFILALLCGVLIGGTSHAEDKILSDELLRAFGEPRIDRGTGDGSAGLVRVTILRSFHSPLMLKWIPTAQGAECELSFIELDQVGPTIKPGRPIQRKVSNKTISAGQQEILRELLSHAKTDDLPEADWRISDFFDGSWWVIELADQNSCKRFYRSNPFVKPSVSALPALELSHDRIAQEYGLISFALMFWSMKGLEGEKIY